MSAFRHLGLEVAPGARGMTRLPVSDVAGGYSLGVPLHVLNGAHPGPTLLVVGVVHGEEIFAIDAIRTALASVDLARLHGTVIAVPVANPPALAANTRNNPLDMLDLNRQFPGSEDGWLSQRIAAAISPLIDRSDCLLHIDGGAIERVIHYVFVKSDGAGNGVTERLSRAFGLKLLYRGSHSGGSITSYAAGRGIPAVLAEIGGSTLYTDPRYLQRASTGVLNVMRTLHMLDGVVAEPAEQLLLTRRTLVRVPVGGIFHPAVGLEAIDAEVRGGTVLGTVMDPYSLEQVAEIRAPYERSALLQMRVLPSAVQPGDYAFIIADLDSAEPARDSPDQGG